MTGVGEQSLVGADLDEVEPASFVADCFEFVVAGVGGVEDAQPVAGRVDLVHGPRSAVDQDHVTEDSGEIRLPNARPLPQGGVERGIGEAAVGGERPVGDHEGQFAPPRGQAECVLGVIAHDMQPGQAPPDRRGGEVHPVVVVPQQRRPLVQRERVVPRQLGHHRPRIVHAAPHPLMPCPVCVAGLGPALGQDEVGRVSVGRRRGPPAVQVHDGRHGQLVAVRHGDRPAAARLDRRPGEGALVRPQRCPDPGQDLRGRLALGDLVTVGAARGARPAPARRESAAAPGTRAAAARRCAARHR